MLIKNHLFLSLVLTGITLTISNASLASEPTTFTSLSACRNHFNTVVQAGNQSTEASDPWCKARMSALDFCTEMALLNSIATTSYNSSQIPALRQSLQTTCQQQLAAQQSSPPAGAPAGGSGTAGAAFNASGAPVPPTPPAQQNCNTLPAAEQSACNIRLAQYQRDLQTYQSNLQAYNQRQAAAQQQQQQQQAQQQQQQQQQNMQGMQMMLGAVAPMLEGSGSRGSNSGNSNVGAGNSGSTAMNSPFGQNTSQAVDRSIAEAERQLARIDAPQASTPAQTRALQGQTGAAANETAAAVPQARTQAEAVANAPASPDGVPVEATELTTAAQQREQRIRQLQQNIQQRLEYLMDGTKSIPLTNVINAYTQIANEYLAYVEDKKLCVQRAELANKLCIEGRSPGARAAKALVDISGPVLAMMSSAQKACSSTRKVMNLAAMGMTVAKGVCVASKVACDMKCADTATKLQAILTKARPVPTTVLGKDITAGNADCKSRAAMQGAAANTLTVCIADLRVKMTTVETINPMLIADLEQEGTPQNGTTPAMIASCQDKGKDILLMATNIMGMMMAKSGAQKCEKQLAAAGGAAGSSSDVTTADYCADAATSGTQFCKCQSNPTAEGCAGSVVAGGLVGDANNQRGANLKAGQGPNGFAGGGARAGGGSDFNLRGGNGTDSSGAALANLEAGGSAFGGGTNGALGGSVAGSGGSSGTAATAGLTAGTDKAADKKWNFGAFAATGGSGASARGSSATGNGNLSSQQQEAIERKIASEKYAAEITTSSGKSNFDKIKSAVRQISSTLDPNQ